MLGTKLHADIKQKILPIITFILLDSTSDDPTRWTMWQQPMPTFNLPVFSSCKFDFFNIGRLIVVNFKNLQKLLNCSTSDPAGQK
jgi:hypothetical protein